MTKKMGIVLCAICMMTALFSFGIVYAEDEGTESPQEPAVVETYADPGEETVVVGNQEDLHNAIEKANARGGRGDRSRRGNGTDDDRTEEQHPV